MSIKTRLDRLERKLLQPWGNGQPEHVVILPSNGQARDANPRKPSICYSGNGSWLIVLPHDPEACRTFEASLASAWGRPWRIVGDDELEWQDERGVWRPCEADHERQNAVGQPGEEAGD
jgi:hypothetical protein